MADKFTVYTDQGDGKPKVAAEFSDEADAQQYYRGKLRTGSRAYVSVGTADKDVLKRKFPRPEATTPANRAMDARISAARAQLADEQVTEQARAIAEKEGVTTAAKSTSQAQKDEKAAAKASEKDAGSSTEPPKQPESENK